METFTLNPSERRRRLVAMAAALVALIASLAIAHFGSTAARANGTSPLFTITTETSPEAPGMVKVSWTEPSGVHDLDSDQWWYYRISWVTTGASPAIGTAVFDALATQRTSTTSAIIPHLQPASNYSITIDVVTTSANTYHQVASIAPVTVNNVAVAVPPLDPCSSGQICGEWATTSAQSGPLLIRTSIYSNLSSGDMNQVGSHGVTWSAQSQWTTHNSRTTKDWIPATFHFVDYSGQLATHWWSPFASDAGLSFEQSTQVLVPTNGPSVNIGTVTLSAGTPISGLLRKEVNGSAQDLVGGVPGSSYVDADGDFVDDRDGDFVDLCVEVLRDTSSQNQNPIEFAGVMCAYRGFGFPDAANPPPAIPTNRGSWRMALPQGEYFIRFVDRPNYFGDANALLYNVRFASQFWRADGGRGEKLFLPSSSPVAPSRLVVAGTPINNVDGVMRVAQQLRVDITDIPFDVTTSASPTLFELQGSVYVQDTVSGAWTGGAMALVTTSALNDPTRVGGATLSASVTGLVSGRAYRVYLRAGNIFGRDREWLGEQWLVGGGTLENASGRVPGPVITEPWPVKPLLVSMHKADGTPYGDGEACLAVFPAGADASGTPAASECTTTRLGPGLVYLQRLPLGSYEVYAYKKKRNGLVDGTPILIDDDFEIGRSLPSGPDGRIVGLSDVSRLNEGAALPEGYSRFAAVVLP